MHIQNGTITCQHGAEECQINRFESCIIDSMQTQDQYVPYIHCLESNLAVRIISQLKICPIPNAGDFSNNHSDITIIVLTT